MFQSGNCQLAVPRLAAQSGARFVRPSLSRGQAARPESSVGRVPVPVSRSFCGWLPAGNSRPAACCQWSFGALTAASGQRSHLSWKMLPVSSTFASTCLWTDASFSVSYQNQRWLLPEALFLNYVKNISPLGERSTYVQSMLDLCHLTHTFTLLTNVTRVPIRIAIKTSR